MAQDRQLQALDLLFQRPLEPIFTSRDNGKSSFDLPDQYYTERYKGVAVELESRFDDSVDVKIPLPEITEPDLKFAQVLGKKKQFSLFNDKHKEIAGKLIKMFMDAKDVTQFTALAAFVRDRINPVLFQYSFAVAVQHRPDTKTVPVKPVAELFPKNFVEPSVFNDGRAEGALISPSNRVHIKIEENYTASDREEEQRLAYFREDIGVNSHHWHWHAVYPNVGPDEVVNKDRRGELFYYMHHQILARYNTERFCNRLSKLKPLSDLRKPIHEGYFPKLMNSTNNRTYPARATNVTLSDVSREDNQIEIVEVGRWADRINEAIDKGFAVTSDGTQVSLDAVTGIDILGNMIERSQLSIYPQFYGNLHNMGHNLICLSHDPEGRHLEEFGVMGDVSTAMRDPVFYRWHGYIDSIFNKFKTLLPGYTDDELGFNGITVNSISCLVDHASAKKNILLTLKEESEVDLAAGLDFGPNGNVFATFTHLQNVAFNYNITVTNESSAQRQGTCRIFLMPQVDERGKPLKFNEVRDLAIEMDKFTVNLQPGQNMLKRRSTQSSVSIPYERSLRRLGGSTVPAANTEAKMEFDFCGCGWPQHMLLPKGTVAGMKFDLYCMISDYTADEVVQSNNEETSMCNDSYSFCGLKDKLYPDKRAMGFPFDRKSVAESLTQFVNAFKNMKKQEIIIKFIEKK